MKLDIYVNYAGTCEQAFRFYEQHLGGRITGMVTHAEQPGGANVPDDWKHAILHARIESVRQCSWEPTSHKPSRCAALI